MGNNGNDQATLEFFKVFGRLWGSCRTFETLGLDTHFLAFEGSHFGSGICILLRGQVRLPGRALDICCAKPTQDTYWLPKCGFSVYWVFCYQNTSMRIGALFSGIHAECGGVRG